MSSAVNNSATAVAAYTPKIDPATREFVMREMARIVDNFPLSLLQAEPVSPMFKDGGTLAGYQEDLTLFVAGLLFCFLLDRLIAKPLFQEKSRYFAIHAVINLGIVSAFSMAEVISVLTEDPLIAFFGPMKTMVPNSFICALHLYHCLAFKLSAEDIFHHLQFAFLLTAMAVPTKNISGASSNFGAFFVSGLPGGLDYVLLCVQKSGHITREQEKRWNMYINLYLRSVGTLIYGAAAWTAWLNPGLSEFRGSPPSVLFFGLAGIGSVLLMFNGLYYQKQSVETHQMYLLKQAAEERKKHGGEGVNPSSK